MGIFCLENLNAARIASGWHESGKPVIRVYDVGVEIVSAGYGRPNPFPNRIWPNINAACSSIAKSNSAFVKLKNLSR